MKKTGILALALLFLCVWVCDVSAAPTPPAIKGRWEATATGPGFAGVAGLLLFQSKKLVTGTVMGLPIANGNITSDGVFTGQLYGENGREYDFQLTLSHNKRTLDGTTIRHYKGIDTIIPMTFTKLSSSPVNPDLTPPAVNHITVDCDNKSVSITWSKPVSGWDLLLRDMTDGIEYYGEELIDGSKNTYDPETNTYTMYVWSGFALDPGHRSITLILDQGSVDWHDPYGVPAWPDSSCAKQFAFTCSH
ncbi:MAG: hypothetical protein LLG06_13450 [Desulfobacteraceae bacterium]|nr:hypothetical protein [Desulfobacteraceae bacterium]